ncbi:streptomycin 6-kinase [Mycolicibacterium iranicum]|uniref:Streptomycin 6-kinase n=1 Tax=Mycolicibacterium iranicum TaxID=912594 RepID=A0A839QH40_MYCIR|nr:aminoglycoside phosphotransferase family protein [Mycolicibacterium iranicum]MBB2991671.1 streptomycin 6-kinase [Mycolicibacterium iranicum]
MIEGDHDLGTVLRNHLTQWQLRVDGPTHEGADSLVTPVRTDDGTAAVLKVSAPQTASPHEHLVLRRWGGDGAVRLLRADPPAHALLLERLRPPRLDESADTIACEVIGGLYRTLHVPALPQLLSATADVADRIEVLRRLPRGAPIPHRLVTQVIALSRDLTADRSGEVVLHGDLHPGKVFTAGRRPWLAVAPRPVNGDRHYEIAPMLWHRWDALTGNIRDGVRHRFHTLVAVADLDEDLARAWTLVRVVHAWTHELLAGAATEAVADAAASSRYAAIAKAVQD